jgi:glutathione peroxidase
MPTPPSRNSRISLLFALAIAIPLSAHAQEPKKPTPDAAKDTLSVPVPDAAKPDAKPDSKKDKGDDDSGAPADAPKGGGGMGGGRRGRGGPGGGAAGGGSDKTAYDYELPGPDGKGIPLSSFKGKTLLVVNLGRNSAYADQVAGLQKLQDQYKDKGLVVIGIPSNEFGAAEPGTEAEIQKFYKDQDKVTFPVMAESKLIGDDALPFSQWLAKASLTETGPIHWNFTKFIIDKTGKPVVRIEPAVSPDSAEMQTIVLQVLEDRYKPPTGGGGPGGRRGGGGNAM